NASQDRIELVDSILELSPAANSPKGLSSFDFSLRYRKPDVTQHETVAGVLSYEHSSSRFRVSGHDLNSKIVAQDSGKQDGIGLAKYLNQNDEAFAVALEQPEVFYTSESFYRIDYAHAELRLSDMLTARTDLKNATSEKGNRGAHKTRWD